MSSVNCRKRLSNLVYFWSLALIRWKLSTHNYIWSVSADWYVCPIINHDTLTNYKRFCYILSGTLMQCIRLTSSAIASFRSHNKSKCSVQQNTPFSFNWIEPNELINFKVVFKLFNWNIKCCKAFYCKKLGEVDFSLYYTILFFCIPEDRTYILPV